MTSKQYEELCRFFIACEYGLDIERVHEMDYTNPPRDCLPEYSHQIDL